MSLLFFFFSCYQVYYSLYSAALLVKTENFFVKNLFSLLKTKNSNKQSTFRVRLQARFVRTKAKMTAKLRTLTKIIFKKQLPNIAGNYSSDVVIQYRYFKKQQVSCKNIEMRNTESNKREKTI